MNPATPAPADPRRARRWMWRSAVVLVLALVSLWYLNPQVMLDVADRIWACF